MPLGAEFSCRANPNVAVTPEERYGGRILALVSNTLVLA